MRLSPRTELLLSLSIPFLVIKNQTACSSGYFSPIQWPPSKYLITMESSTSQRMANVGKE